VHLRKIKYKNHPIVGNLELDFCNPQNNKVYNNIVFAGENGTGKTTILETISTFLNARSFAPFEYIEYEAFGNIFTAVQNPQSALDDFFDIVGSDGNHRYISANRNNKFPSIELDTQDPRRYGCMLSKARSDYKTNKITATTTQALDSSKYDVDESDDYSSLKQLLVDIQNQDNSEYTILNRERSTQPVSWETFYPSSKLRRFENAFNSFFEKMKYYRVHDENGEKVIKFEKNGKFIPIDALSTGEKQIVFRGAYLLKNNNNLDGSVCMIDEPELSMHPKWQNKIFKYYTDLFKTESSQKAQLMFATHSEFVVREALRNKNDSLVIVLTDSNGTVAANKILLPLVLPSISSAETNYLAFDTPSIDYHIELYGYLQEKHNFGTVKRCDEFIASHAKFDPAQHGFSSCNPHGTQYSTLCTYIRNAIDHPSNAATYTDLQLRQSIKLLIELCR